MEKHLEKIKPIKLRKKMNEHFSSKAYQESEQQLKYRSEDLILKSFDKVNEKFADPTRKIFNTVYSKAKRCRPFPDIQKEIELQAKNELYMGVGIHSRKTVVNIVDHIGSEIKKEIICKIMAKKIENLHYN